jgi:hypothetical protein
VRWLAGAVSFFKTAVGKKRLIITALVGPIMPDYFYIVSRRDAYLEQR